MLESVGVSQLGEHIYGELLERRQATQKDLVSIVGVGAAKTERALRQLQDLGLVSRLPGRSAAYVPAPPDVAIEALIGRRQEELNRTRMVAAQLAQQFRSVARHVEPAELIEVITGRDAVVQRFRQLMLTATEEVLMCDVPPYVNTSDNVDTELSVLERGVTWRALYAPAALEVDGQLDRLRRLAASGEQARVLPGLSIKLTITDRRAALLPLTTTRTAIVGAVLVRAPSLLFALTALFDAWWAQAINLPLDCGATTPSRAIDELDRGLLMLLASGVKDDAISRQLGISPRTIHRRLAALMERFGVATRFQLALVAAKRGLL